MLHPSYMEMIDRMNDTKNSEDMEVTSRYSLVIAAAKRARQINSGSAPLVSTKAKEKNLSIAVDEIFAGKVHILEEGEETEEASEEITDETEEVSEEITDETEEVSEDEVTEDTEDVTEENLEENED